MSQDYLQIVFDTQTKIWKSVNYPYKNILNTSLGEQFLRTMRTIDENKIIDHFYDKNIMKTARQVYEESILIALNLQRLGVTKGDVVILFSMNNEMTAVLTLGCILIGALPNFIEVHMEEEHIGNLFENLQPTVIIHEEKYLPKIQQSLKLCNLQSIGNLISMDGPQPNVYNELLKYNSEVDFSNFKSVEVKDPQQEIVCFVLTSGSTGIPKIVQITHALMMHGSSIWWDNEKNYEPIREDCVLFSFSPLRWISQIVVLLESMLFGIKRVSSCGVPNGQYGLNVLRVSGITHLFVAPSIFYDILLQLDDDDTESLKSLKVILLGGEPPSREAMDLTRKHAVNAKPFHCYGMTEMCTCISTDEFINGGKPLPGYELQILDENLKPLGPNEPGQIAIKPPVPLKNYRGLEHETCLNDAGLFISGDYGIMDNDNKLHILARYKDLIKSNGNTVIPNALEYVIINLPEVYVARLTAYRKTPEDPNEVGALFVVLNANVSVSQTEISSKIYDVLKSQLTAEQLAIIQDIHYVDSVPLTTCGKIDRVALRKLALHTKSRK